MQMSDELFNSDLEKTNLAVHVDLSRQRYIILNNKVDRAEEKMDKIANELSDFRQEHTKNITDLMQSHLDAIALIREDYADDNHSTTRVVIGAAATIGSGLLSVIVVLLVAFL